MHWTQEFAKEHMNTLSLRFWPLVHTEGNSAMLNIQFHDSCYMFKSKGNDFHFSCPQSPCKQINLNPKVIKLCENAFVDFGEKVRIGVCREYDPQKHLGKEKDKLVNLQLLSLRKYECIRFLHYKVWFYSVCWVSIFFSLCSILHAKLGMWLAASRTFQMLHWRTRNILWH